MLLSTLTTSAEEVTVKVVDQSGMSGVASRITMSRDTGKAMGVEVGSTDEKGVLAFEHACMPGDQLFAEPLDGSYYRSEGAACKESVLLRVKRRQMPEDELVDRSRSVFLVEYTDGTSREYVAEYDGIMNEREVSLRSMSGSFCYMKLIFKLNRDVYLVEENGAWSKDDEKSLSETLVKDRTKTSLAGSCARPPGAIYGKVEASGKQRMRSRISKDLQGLSSQLRKMKGVESVELQ